MSLRQSYTAAVERNQEWRGQFATEPYEAAWASEAIFFVRALDSQGLSADGDGGQARVQISPDGIHWVDEGAVMQLPTAPDQLAFCKTKHFGGWLRLQGELPPAAKLTVLVYLSLKE